LLTKGNGARGARVDLEDEDLAALDRVLRVHQADHLEGGREPARVVADRVEHRGRERVRRITHAESPEWMPASSMCSMMPATTTVSPSARQSTSTSTASSRNLVDQDRVPARRGEGLAGKLLE